MKRLLLFIFAAVACSLLNAATPLYVFSWDGVNSDDVVANTLYTKDLSTLIFNPPLAEPTIVDGVKRIERYAFAFSALAKKIELPKSVEEIGRSAFMDCSALSCVVLNEGLRELPVMAFNSCHLLKEVVIPSSVEVLHKSTFYPCPTLEKITLRSNTITIEPKAFSYCRDKVLIVRG